MTERPFHRKTYGCVVSEIAHSTHNRENAATRRSSWRQRGGRAIESVCVTPTQLSFLCFGPDLDHQPEIRRPSGAALVLAWRIFHEKTAVRHQLGRSLPARSSCIPPRYCRVPLNSAWFTLLRRFGSIDRLSHEVQDS